MNLNFLKYAFAGIFLFAAADAFSQFVPDTVVTQPDEVQVVTQQQKIIEPVQESGKYYKWETPILEKVDLRGIEMYKSNSEKYLQNIEIL